MNVPQNVLDLVPGSASQDWHQHANGGGWVYKSATVAATAYIGRDAAVYGNARVYGNAWVTGDARVSGNALVTGDAWVFGTTWVFGDAQVTGDAQVSGNARVYGTAQVFGKAWVYDDAQVSGDARVSGNARVSGDAWKQSPLQIQGTRHFVTLCSMNEIAIGCHIHDFAYWKENFQTIGKTNDYSPAEIKEYHAYIGLCIAFAKSIAARTKKVKA